MSIGARSAAHGPSDQPEPAGEPRRAAGGSIGAAGLVGALGHAARAAGGLGWARWSSYMQAFHRERPGVTEEVLQRAVAGSHNPYDWLARSVSGSTQRVLDAACGSGAMGRRLASPGRTVVGLDLSPQEIGRAASLSGGPWVVADALRMPVADASVDAVVSTLGLAVINPLDDFLAEVSRVLRPGGVFAALTPTTWPLSPADIRVAAQITRRLRAVPHFPVAIEFASGPVLGHSGLRKVEDNRESYRFPVRSRADADLLLSAMYLPTAGQAHIAAATRWLEQQVDRRGQVEVPIPLRRIVALKPTG